MTYQPAINLLRLQNLRLEWVFLKYHLITDPAGVDADKVVQVARCMSYIQEGFERDVDEDFEEELDGQGGKVVTAWDLRGR